MHTGNTNPESTKPNAESDNNTYMNYRFWNGAFRGVAWITVGGRRRPLPAHSSIYLCKASPAPTTPSGSETLNFLAIATEKNSKYLVSAAFARRAGF